MAEERPLRLLMEPHTKLRRCRWVYELNGHPGQCSEDHWHADEIEALACFRGER